MPRNCAMLAPLVLALAMPLAQARVTRIVIDEVRPFPAADSGGIPTEQVAGRAFGELDPAAPANAVINDVQLARDADGKARYVATFVITRPVELTRASGLMWHEVPNRGVRRPSVVAERANGDIDLTSAWQGDNAGATRVREAAAVDQPHWLKLPVVRLADGSPNRSGARSQPLIVQTNPVPYKPVSLDTREARLVSRVAESTRGEVIGETTIAPTDWAWAKCDAANPFPGRPDPMQICLKNGFDAGTPNPLAGAVTNRDPRPSLEERYGNHDGYVAAVRKAADQARGAGLLLPADAERLVNEAGASQVLR